MGLPPCLLPLASDHFVFLEVTGERGERKGEGEEETPKKVKLSTPMKAGRKAAVGPCMKIPVDRCPLTSTFSTTCFPKEHTLVEQVTVIFSELSY